MSADELADWLESMIGHTCCEDPDVSETNMREIARRLREIAR